MRFCTGYNPDTAFAWVWYSIFLSRRSYLPTAGGTVG